MMTRHCQKQPDHPTILHALMPSPQHPPEFASSISTGGSPPLSTAEPHRQISLCCEVKLHASPPAIRLHTYRECAIVPAGEYRTIISGCYSGYRSRECRMQMKGYASRKWRGTLQTLYNKLNFQVTFFFRTSYSVC